MVTAEEQERIRNARREQWRNALEASEGKGVNAVRCKCGSLYAALYRNDKEWLLEVNKGLHFKPPTNDHVDWEQRDVELCDKLESHVQKLLNAPDRPQLTLTTLIKPFDYSMITKNFDKLPCLRQMANGYMESEEDYHKYRVDRAIENIKTQSRSLALWRIVKFAGLRKLCDAAVGYANKRMIEEANTYA